MREPSSKGRDIVAAKEKACINAVLESRQNNIKKLKALEGLSAVCLLLCKDYCIVAKVQERINRKDENAKHANDNAKE